MRVKMVMMVMVVMMVMMPGSPTLASQGIDDSLFSYYCCVFQHASTMSRADLITSLNAFNADGPTLRRSVPNNNEWSRIINVISTALNCINSNHDDFARRILSETFSTPLYTSMNLGSDLTY
nr:uncharacterized protein LOC123768635 [Procambarus clarkii]XP_045615217.1 uncharacterized protein LOC123768635 [Procambarus clarkii]XP_045615218.1 uncharacterized protein LOC123768635 [Procambarus clarkii]